MDPLIHSSKGPVLHLHRDAVILLLRYGGFDTQLKQYRG